MENRRENKQAYKFSKAGRNMYYRLGCLVVVRVGFEVTYSGAGSPYLQKKLMEASSLAVAGCVVGSFIH